MNEKQSNKWTTVRVLREQLDRVSELVKSNAAQRLGYNNVATALKIALNNICKEIENEAEK